GNTFQKCETKIQTCPIVNVAKGVFSTHRRARKKISRRNRLRAECACQAKSQKSLQPQKDKGTAAGRRYRLAVDSPDGGITELTLQRYPKILPEAAILFLFYTLPQRGKAARFR
ncbi:MAG: hypothetical protein JF571_03860, partial [Asticcacaulis sp.]|nr:hypothetical protein [Asticcacaulis sp.]